MPRTKKKQTSEGFKLQDFVYVDFRFEFFIDGEKRVSSWQRIHMDDIPKMMQKHAGRGVMVTVQRFLNAEEVVTENTIAIAPLYFDIDYSKKLFQLVESGVITHYDLELIGVQEEAVEAVKKFEAGMVTLDTIKNHLISLEATEKKVQDLVWQKNLQLAQEETIKIVKFFIEEFGLEQEHVRVFFSGNKGFHVIVNETVAGIQPDTLGTLKGINRLVAYELETQLGVKGIDKAAISTRRCLKLVNSRHLSSNLWKIELTHKELFSETLVQDIKTLASAPRNGMTPYPIIEVFEVNEKLAKWIARKKEEHQNTVKIYTERPTLTNDVLQKMEGYPECVKFLLENGIVKEDSRNQATMALASYFKDAGVPLEEALPILLDWASRLPSEYVSSPPQKVLKDTEYVTRYIYEHENYHFACHFIRALSDRENGKVIPCAEWRCPMDKDYRPPNEEATLLHLSETGDAKYAGQFVASKVLLAGKLDTPYMVPKKIKYTCAHQPYCNKPCVMHDYNGVCEKTIPESDRILIEMTAQSDTQTKGSLRRYIKASCDKVQPEPLERTNVTELLVVPMAERINTVKNDENKDIVRDETGKQYEYTQRKVYCLDPYVQANEYYLIKGYVYPHPRTAEATILITEAEPLNDSIRDFRLTPEIKQQFTVFQTDAKHNTTEDVKKLDDHLEMLVNDLANNVTRVYKREDVHLGMLLTYHSCLSYYFQGEHIKRGWLEMVCVGDSGQAKSTVMSKLSEFTGLGSIINAEGASRTGLSYRIAKEGDRFFIEWGKYTLSDRKLLAIDEFSELSQEDFGNLTHAREAGVIKVDRRVNAEANARVRLIMLTNPAKGRTLDEFTYPVESLRYLYESPADIRRIDLALFLKAGDVPQEVVNQEYVKPEVQLITSEALRNSILWAWSREPEQIVIRPKAVKLILRKANELGEKYGHASTIPLCNTSDLRFKLARLSIAVAMLVHSTDETHETVFVEPAHVAWVAEFLDRIYSASNCRFDEYNESVRAESELTDEEFVAITEALAKFDKEDDNPGLSMDILKIFARNNVVKANMIREWLAVEPGKIHKRLKYLNDTSMIKTSTRDALRMMPKLKEYLKRRGIK